MSIKRHIPLTVLLLATLFSQHAFADIAIKGAYILAGPPSATTHAAYLSITNNNEEPVVLCHVNSAQFKTIEIHETVLTDDVFSMKHLESITIAPHNTAQLKPSGPHLMLFRTRAPLKRGENIEMELVFEQAESISVSFPIRTPADM